MARRKQTNKSAQHSLWEYAPRYDVVSALKDAMRHAVEHSELSRDQVVDAMNSIAAKRGARLSNGNAQALTRAVLDKWLDPADGQRLIPVRALDIFCEATGSIAPLDAIAQALGARVVGPADIKKIEYFDTHMALERSRKTARQLRQEIEELEG
ncbi:hypothetical protein [Desulfocurvibacter africanus]|uniref:Uncharacterized protein n=1 Tax=Desulfocurvibacter africanus subsp. africanus str. Walvis Bay TaxID=690850 RepID=F3YVY4_DESAF|nr:hypothetical protein [Desulfocurvibacter africanus]EGJ49014.1 hypothetical protein Desaf_0662 [Desulfocurvibacter africanus subsp. africanus str. Walvis Bay]